MSVDDWMRETVQVLGTDMLRRYRDEVIRELARREQNAPAADVVRENVLVQLKHRPHLGRKGDPMEYAVLKEFVLHPAQIAAGDGVMLNHESIRDHLWVEARWL